MAALQSLRTLRSIRQYARCFHSEKTKLLMQTTMQPVLTENYLLKIKYLHCNQH